MWCQREPQGPGYGPAGSGFSCPKPEPSEVLLVEDPDHDLVELVCQADLAVLARRGALPLTVHST